MTSSGETRFADGRDSSLEMRDASLLSVPGVIGSDVSMTEKKAEREEELSMAVAEGHLPKALNGGRRSRPVCELPSTTAREG